MLAAALTPACFVHANKREKLVRDRREPHSFQRELWLVSRVFVCASIGREKPGLSGAAWKRHARDIIPATRDKHRTLPH